MNAVNNLAKTIGVKTKLVMLIVLTSLFSIIFVSIISQNVSKSSIEELANNQLISLREIAKNRISSFFDRSNAFTVKLATDRLTEGLFLAYESAFYGGGFDPGKDEIIDTQEYKVLNQKYGSRIKSIVNDYNFANMLLITIDGQITMNAIESRGIKLLGKNLEGGSLKGTKLSSCFNKARNSKSHEVIFSEYEYIPTLDRTTAFLCAKQVAEFAHLSEGINIGDPMGIVAVEISIDSINSMTTQRHGMGKTGQTYIVGEDKKLRSDFFIQREKMNVNNSFKDNNLVTTPAVTRALNGESGLMRTTDPNGFEVLSAFTQIELFGKKWAIISEKQVDEVFSPIKKMFIYITISSLIIFLIALAIGMLAGGIIAKPLYILRDKLNHSASLINHVSIDISSASDDLQTASTRQASAIEETSASLEELVGTVAQNVSNSELAQNVSSGVEKISSEGNESMEKLVQSMKEILASNDQLKDLVNVIKEIGGKTEVIDEIVFQTKLLSFNASVEAERAGEHGRGFAVVAQEVGNLAAMSGNAALEISTLVKNSITTAQVITADNEERVKGGNDMVEVVSEILQKIEKSSKQSAEYASQIFTSSREQDLGIREINEAILEVDKITQLTSVVATKTSSQSDTLKDNALELDHIVHELSIAVTGDKKSK